MTTSSRPLKQFGEIIRKSEKLGVSAKTKILIILSFRTLIDHLTMKSISRGRPS